jgi:hypothetical protein
MEGRRKEWRLIRAVLPSLAASAVFLGVGGVDGVECVALSGPSVVNERYDLIYVLYLHYRYLSSVFYNFFGRVEKKCENAEKSC